jgi:hypothetical protein
VMHKSWSFYQALYQSSSAKIFSKTIKISLWSKVGHKNANYLAKMTDLL